MKVSLKRFIPKGRKSITFGDYRAKVLQRRFVEPVTVKQVKEKSSLLYTHHFNDVIVQITDSGYCIVKYKKDDKWHTISCNCNDIIINSVMWRDAQSIDLSYISQTPLFDALYGYFICDAIEDNNHNNLHVVYGLDETFGSPFNDPFEDAYKKHVEDEYRFQRNIAIKDILNNLTPKEKKTLEVFLKCNGTCNQEEMAQRLGIPRTTFSSRYNKIKRKLDKFIF